MTNANIQIVRGHKISYEAQVLHDSATILAAANYERLGLALLAEIPKLLRLVLLIRELLATLTMRGSHAAKVMLGDILVW